MAKPTFIFEFPRKSSIRKNNSENKLRANGNVVDSHNEDMKSDTEIGNSYRNDIGHSVTDTMDADMGSTNSLSNTETTSHTDNHNNNTEGGVSRTSPQDDIVDEQMVIDQAFSQISQVVQSDEDNVEDFQCDTLQPSAHRLDDNIVPSDGSDSLHDTEETSQTEISTSERTQTSELPRRDENAQTSHRSHSPDKVGNDSSSYDDIPDQLQTKDDSCQTEESMDSSVTEANHVEEKRQDLNTYTGTEPSAFLESLTDVRHKVITLEIEAPHHPTVDGVDNLGFRNDASTVSGDFKRRKSVGFLASVDDGDNLGYEEERKLAKRRRSIRYSIYDILQRPNESSSRKKIGRFLVTFAAAINMYFNMGICFSLGTFLPSWLEEFQEKRSKTALIQSFTIGMIFGSGIIVGILVDRYGVRISIIGGSIVASLGLLGAVFCPNTVSLMISLGFLTGLGSSFVQLGSGVTISLTYKNSASVGLGLITAGGGLGGSTMPYIMKALIDYYGWRGAFYILSGLALQTVVSSYLMTSFMEQAVGGRRAAKREPIAWKTKVKTICRPKFVLNILATMTGFGTMNGFVFVIVDYADKNNGDGVFYLFLATVLSTAARLAFGCINMLPVVNSSVLLAIAVICGGASILLLSISTSYIFTLFLICLFGICYGGLIGIYGVVVLDLVGRDTFALAIGIGSTFNGTASTLGGFFFGLLYDLTKTYSRALVIMGSIPVVFGTVPILLVLKDTICRTVSSIRHKSSV